VRDLAREQGKEADLLVHGEDIQVDRRVLDELKDPLIHLLRNCVDHGIEKPETRRELGKSSHGSVTISAKPVEGSRVELTVADDGSGIDADKVTKAAVRLGLIAADEAGRLTEVDVTELIFHSGLSTSPIITDLSGRGLGLAIVREKVEKLGGTITVISTPGTGTAFRMLVPLSLATFRGVFVEVAGRRFVIPTASVVRVSRVRPEEIKTIENRQTLALGGRAVSLVRLRDVLELSGPDGRSNGAARPVVIARAADRQIAFLVDEVQGEQEVMVKTLGQQLARVRNVAGACVSGSGTVVPILNVVDLVQSASTAGAPGPVDAVQDTAPERRGRLIIAEDSITARTLLKNILEGDGYEVVASVDGVDALTRLKTEPFDLLVSDVDMPRMNGFELTAKIRADKKLGELPVVLVTALGSQKDREYGIEVGANAYIVKSDFDQSNLIEIIRRLL
jgi:two-component system chemotaxis sensor kinase CheA